MPDVAIRISPAPVGPGGASHLRGYGLPRRLSAPRNDVVIFGWSCYFGCSFVQTGRRAIRESPLHFLPSSTTTAGPHVFYSTADKHHVGQFGSGHCPK